jgi:hypothetical protein
VKPSLEVEIKKPHQHIAQGPAKSELQKFAQLTKSSASSADNTMGIITKYIGDKLREIKAYEGTSLAREAKEELRSYLETFQKDERMVREFKNHSPELVKDIQHLYQKQQQQIREHQRSKDMGMDM